MIELTILCVAVIVSAASVTIASSNLIATLENNYADLRLKDRASPLQFNEFNVSVPFWEAQLSNATASLLVDSHDSTSTRTVLRYSPTTLIVQYATSQYEVIVSLNASGDSVTMTSSFSSTVYKLWQFTFRLAFSGDSGDQLLVPHGWGVVHSAYETIVPASFQTYTYPSSQATMQLFSYWAANAQRALYFASHDGQGHTKTFTYAASNPLSCRLFASRCIGVWEMRVLADVRAQWTMPFALSMRTFDATTSDRWWYGAAQLCE
jgi:hypothetical protein